MHYRNSAIALGALALGLALPGAAQAAAYIKFDGIKGESKVASLGFQGEGEGYTGGVRVAVGDVNGDGTPDAPPAPPRAGAAGDIAAPGPRQQTIGLLLPAVQKVREAAAARPKGMACEVGATLRNLTIRMEETAQVVRVPEATVTACMTEQISLNFTKVEAINPSGRRYRATVRQ